MRKSNYKVEVVLDLIYNIYPWTDAIYKLVEQYLMHDTSYVAKDISILLSEGEILEIFDKYKFEDWIDVYDKEDVRINTIFQTEIKNGMFFLI